jgi:hypothetical protein
MKNRLFLFVLFICSFSVYAQNDRSTIKILTIGNSFSVDAVESYLSDLAITADVSMLIGNLYISGCSVEKHWNCAKDNLQAYDYNKIYEKGERETIKKSTLQSALMDENWDYISFQQVSSLSGIYESFFPYLENLLKYVKSNIQSPDDTKYILHMTWAYETTSTHPDFVNYGKNQTIMYEAIKTTFPRIAKTMYFDHIIPSGIAIQEMRQVTNKDVCRDGFHLNNGLGKYTASCTWFEALSGQTVVGNSFYPEAEITQEEAFFAQEAARKAVSEMMELMHSKSALISCDTHKQWQEQEGSDQ